MLSHSLEELPVNARKSSFRNYHSTNIDKLENEEHSPISVAENSITTPVWFRIVGVVLTAVVNGFNNLSGASLIYIPNTGHEKGMKSGVSGIVTGLSNSTAGLFIFIIPSLVIMSKKKEMILCAMMCCVITNALFAITFYAEPGIFEVLCIAIQFINGVGNAVIGTLAISMACSAFPSNSGRVIGYCNISNGISRLYPTFIATFFYNIGGYVASFMWVAVAQFCVVVAGVIFMRDYNKHVAEQKKDGINFKILAKFVLHPHTLSVSTSICMCGALFGFATNTLGPHLRNRYGVHDNVINFYMSGYAIFLLIAFLIMTLSVEAGYGGLAVLAGGFLCIVVCIIWLLPSFIPFLDSEYSILVGLLLMGVQNGIIQLGMYLMYEKLAEIRQAFSMDQVKVVTAVLVIGVYDIGYFSGTLAFGGFIYQYGSFELSVILLLIISIIFLLPLVYTLFKYGLLGHTYYSKQ